MTARAIMIQGTGSNVGKSLICTGLCRAFTDAGLKVMPFKPQNMSNNAAIAEGGEIGRAQALQAKAARQIPGTDMNPILLKPESERGAQVIVHGRREACLSAREYFARRGAFLPRVMESFARLCARADLVIVEGAGSPAEVNLRRGDIANMGFAEAADIPVVLVGDVHRGGVIAALAGTLAVIEEADAARISAFLVNNFHGDPALFSGAVDFLQARLKRPCLGVVPHFAQAARLPAEDAVALEEAEARDGKSARLRIAVPRLSRIANFDDLDPLRAEPEVMVEIVPPGRPIPREADLIILPGSKATMADLAFLREQGWDIDIRAHVRQGGRVFGICGGYQMLGRVVHDPLGLEGPPGAQPGLGLLDVETRLAAEKTTRETQGIHAASGEALRAYEIHLGETTGADRARPFARLADGRAEGATSPDGLVQGTYLHGAFTADGFRRAWLAGFGAESGREGFEARVERTLDELAEHLRSHIDLDALLKLAQVPRLP